MPFHIKILSCLTPIILACTVVEHSFASETVTGAEQLSLRDQVMSSEGKSARIEVEIKEASLLELGSERLDQYSGFLSQLEYYYGVDREVIMGIWGVESRYGQNVGSMPFGSAMRQLAAREPWKRDFTSHQIRSAMRLVKNGVIDPSDLVGSWAGALGQTQFIPSSYERFGVDGDFDGRIDLWDAHDALASTANYLRAHGWNKGQKWGQAVELPDDFYNDSAHKTRHEVAYWKKVGVKPKYDKDLQEGAHGYVERYLGQDYLLYDNFFVILKYNASRDYAFDVSALGDQVVKPDAPGVQEIGSMVNAGANIRSSATATKKVGCRNKKVCGLQAKLRREGYYSGPIDGVYGPQTKRALGRYLLSKRQR